MAITANCSSLLFYVRRLGVSYELTLTLGRLTLYASRADIQADIERFGNPAKTLAEVEFPDEYAESLFEILGANTTESLDFSDYEKATHIHDLNKPVPAALHDRYSAVVDGGTIEHVFNFPQAIENAMRVLRMGGHYIGITPVNNTMGHGFYQFSPELYYRVFSPENGFKVIFAAFYTLNEKQKAGKWYKVPDPKTVQSRVMLVNHYPTHLMVVAEKIAEADIFAQIPQQSDYTATWTIHKSLETGERPQGESKLKFLYRKLTPRPLKVLMRRVYNFFFKRKVNHPELGSIEAGHFEEVKF